MSSKVKDTEPNPSEVKCGVSGVSPRNCTILLLYSTYHELSQSHKSFDVRRFYTPGVHFLTFSDNSQLTGK